MTDGTDGTHGPQDDAQKHRELAEPQARPPLPGGDADVELRKEIASLPGPLRDRLSAAGFDLERLCRLAAPLRARARGEGAARSSSGSGSGTSTDREDRNRVPGVVE